jgi:hypothetical protein
MGFWTPSTILLSLALLLAAPSPARPVGSAGGIGYAEGAAWAEFLLEPAAAPAPPDYANDGFRQQVSELEVGWRVRVDVRLSPPPARAPFNPTVIPDLGVPLDWVSGLSESLGPCRTVPEAVDAVLLFLRRHVRYRERVSFEESPQRVFERGEASCVGLTRCARAILGGLGISSREVLGLKLPPGRKTVVLEGGMLHAWLEVDYPGSGPAFCDPLRSSGWVGAQYVVLRRGEGLEVGGLAALKGCRMTREGWEDRVFFEPLAGTPATIWARAWAPASAGSLLSGKLLDADGDPVAGEAALSRGGYAVSMPLWDGNFFFTGLAPGTYRLRLTPRAGQAREETLSVGSRQKRYLVFCSLDDGRSKAGGAHEPGR